MRSASFTALSLRSQSKRLISTERCTCYSCHKEEQDDTQIFLHSVHAERSGVKIVLGHNIDCDVAVLAINRLKLPNGAV